MAGRKMRIALVVSWLLTAVAIALVLHLRAQNSEQAERIRRLEAMSNLQAIGKTARIYQEQFFSTPSKSERDGRP